MSSDPFPSRPVSGLTRGQLAREAGVNPETIRFYETHAILPPPRRDASGYRRYGTDDVWRLRFVRRAQELGFSLAEVRELLSLRATPSAESRAVKTLARQKMESIEGRIRDLQRMKRVLKSIDACCDGRGTTEECPILKALEGT